MRKIDLMIIGAQKAGTTSLNNYLAEHPELLGHPQLEFGYFRNDEEFKEGYEKAFKKCFTEGNLNSAKKIIAKSVGIYDNEKAIKRLYEHNPDCLIVYILRNPVERAYSSFTMEKSNGWLNRDFDELSRLIKENKKDDYMYKFFLSLGLYSEHLKKVYKYFPENQVKIYLFEDLKKEPNIICKQLFQLLKVDTSFNPEFDKVHNKTKKVKSEVLAKVLINLRNNNNLFKRFAKSILPYHTFTKLSYFLLDLNKSKNDYESMPKDIEELLYDFFEPYNEELEKMTGIKLKSWGTRSERQKVLQH